MANREDKMTIEEQPIGIGNTQQDSAVEAPVAEATPSWMDRLGMIAVTAQAQEDARQKEYAAAQERTQRQREAVNEALQRGTSVWNSLLEKQKPVYDVDKEKRLRNRAIIQSLGDILSSTAKGAIAYGRKGMGYVPQSADSGHFKSLEEMNRLQEEYAKRKEAWRELALTSRAQQAQNEVAAAQALLKAYEADEKEAGRELTDARKATRTAVSDVAKAGIRADEKAEERRWRVEDREDRQASTAAIKALGGGGARSANATLTERGNIHRLLTEGETYETVTEVPEIEEYNTGEKDSNGKDIWKTREVVKRSKTIRPRTYTTAQHNAIGEYDPRIDVVLKYKKEGMSEADAVAKVLEETKK